MTKAYESKTKMNTDTNVTRQILQITLRQTQKYTPSNSITQILN